MRRAFVDTLCELAAKEPKILLLTADLGYFFLEPFRDKFPKQFFNVGVSEQNMIGLAAGLAKEGFIPFVYSIVPFATLRPFEFIRNGPCAHNLRVRVVGVGSGFDYGQDGLTHYGLEDIAVMRTQPNMKVIAAADPAQLSSAMKATLYTEGPIYFRVAKSESPKVAELNGHFELGRADTLRKGKDFLFISTGNISPTVLKVVDKVNQSGARYGHMVVASIAPAPIHDLKEALSTAKVAITVEAHSTTGGLGSLVAEIIAENQIPCRLIRRGIEKVKDGKTGSTSFMNKLHGLDEESLLSIVSELS